MLPYSDNLPAFVFESLPHAFVASLVSFDFADPVLLIGDRKAAVLGAAVPEASVYEKNKTTPGIDEVRLAEKRIVTAPAVEIVCAKKCDQLKFCRFVALRSNPGHDARTFGWTDFVHNVLI